MAEAHQGKSRLAGKAHPMKVFIAVLPPERWPLERQFSINHGETQEVPSRLAADRATAAAYAIARQGGQAVGARHGDGCYAVGAFLPRLRP
jgi:hypothetical protein